MSERFDLVIVGGGAAGLTAGLFACRYGLSTVLLERLMPGGQVVNAEKIENYPGIGALAGAELGANIQDQAMELGLEVRLTEATGFRASGSSYRIETSEDGFEARAVILAGGSTLRKLGVPGEDRLTGLGVSNCATCDGGFFAGQPVAVIGGGDSAADEALTLTHFASSVTVVHREPLIAQRVLRRAVQQSPTISLISDTEVTAIQGNGKVSGLETRHLKTGEIGSIAVNGVFIFVGLEPNTAWLNSVLPLDPAGHIPVDLSMRTALPGVFAAGDIRQHSAAQLITSAGDGATAAISAYRYLIG